MPTTAGTGSEVTLWAVITDPARHIKYNAGGTGLIAPYVALIDPLLMLDMPAHITASTGLDALTHAIECYTCGYAQPWPDAVALWAMETLAQWLPIAFAQGHNQEARYKVAMAAMLAGMPYGIESAGAVHAMSQTAGAVHAMSQTAGAYNDPQTIGYSARPDQEELRADLPELLRSLAIGAQELALAHRWSRTSGEQRGGTGPAKAGVRRPAAKNPLISRRRVL